MRHLSMESARLRRREPRSLRVQIVYAPAADPSLPYGSLPLLKSLLHQGGYHNVRLRDLNLEMFDDLIRVEPVTDAAEQTRQASATRDIRRYGLKIAQEVIILNCFFNNSCSMIFVDSATAAPPERPPYACSDLPVVLATDLSARSVWPLIEIETSILARLRELASADDIVTTLGSSDVHRAEIEGAIERLVKQGIVKLVELPLREALEPALGEEAS